MLEAKSRCATRTGWKSDSTCKTKGFDRRSSVTNKVDNAKLIGQILQQANNNFTTGTMGVWGIAPAIAVSGVYHVVDDM